MNITSQTRAFVFAPALFLTVTLERRGDADEVHLHPGGQGLWIARMLASLGVDVVLRHELDELYGAAVIAALEVSVSVLGGPHDPSPVPADVYRRLARDIRPGDRRVVADLSGPPLEAVLEGGVDVLKVSHEELVADRRASGDTLDDLAATAGVLQRPGAHNVVVSRGDQPALLLAGNDAYEIAAPPLTAADPAGAGDSMTAGIAAGLVERLCFVDAVRLGAAAGALNAARHGKGTGDRSKVERLATYVEARRLGKRPSATSSIG